MYTNALSLFTLGLIVALPSAALADLSVSFMNMDGLAAYRAVCCSFALSLAKLLLAKFKGVPPMIRRLTLELAALKFYAKFRSLSKAASSTEITFVSTLTAVLPENSRSLLGWLVFAMGRLSFFFWLRKLRMDILSMIVWRGCCMATLALRGASKLSSLSKGYWCAWGEKGLDCAAVVADAIRKLPFLFDETAFDLPHLRRKLRWARSVLSWQRRSLLI